MTNELRKNRFKAALIEGRLQRGVWCTMTDSLAVEMIATLGFDWMMFDTEHSAMDPISVLPLLQAIAPYPVSPIVRPGSLNPAEMRSASSEARRRRFFGLCGSQLPQSPLSRGVPGDDPQPSTV